MHRRSLLPSNDCVMMHRTWVDKNDPSLSYVLGTLDKLFKDGRPDRELFRFPMKNHNLQMAAKLFKREITHFRRTNNLLDLM